MTLLTTTAELAAFCETLTGAEFVTVDTEFMRERTYWPKLCLVQLGGPRKSPRSIRWPRHRSQPLFELMANPKSSRFFTPRGRMWKFSSI